MKIATDSEVKDYTQAIVIGGLKGAAIGLGVSLGAVYWARGRNTIFRTMTPTFKTFFFMSPILACGVTATEWASLKFDMEQYDFGEAEKARKAEREKIDSLPFLERAKVYGIENKYKIIVGAWAASLGGSFWWINRDKFLTKSQKIVQARMYAQALTVVILLGSMLLSVNSYQGAKKAEDEKYSWQAIVAEEEKREKEAGLPLRLSSTK
ncbi:hypothetical protein D0Z00_004462 [Geotrichum galactomycetum]|uniref:Uncharacterized protein n=1 Tax=Geotrichum galactomycetum TaxID=27317 RepID=A0ACB6UYB4_9ASCO|nr:hypothetical protein D0Z00_004462 [Geotrichum candidum]